MDEAKELRINTPSAHLRRVGGFKRQLWSILSTSVISLLLGSGAVSALGQGARNNLERGAWNYTSRSWQSQNGLAGETVQAFAETHDGFLWIGTTEGLLRFDGAQFTLFSHENTPAIHENSVFCLLASRDGVLWIGTDGGGLVEMRNGAFRAYSAADGLTDVFIRALLEDSKGDIWVAADSGLFKGRNGHFERIDNTEDMPGTAFHGLFQDHTGRVWAGAAEMYAIQEGRHPSYALQGSDSQNRVKSVVETEDGSIWVGTVDGLHRLAPGHPRFERVPGVWGTVRALCGVSQGELWAGTIGQGIFRIRFTSQPAQVTRLNAPSPLMSNTVLSIFQDGDRNLWIGTQVGMVRLSHTPVRVLSLPTAADSDFGTVNLDSDGSLWAASNQLVHIVGNRVVPARFPGMSNVHIRNVLRTRDGTLWIGTDGSGIFRIKGGTTTQFTINQGLINNFIRGTLEARDGSVWIGTDSGVSHYINGAFHNLTDRSGLTHFSMRSLLEDHNGDIWLGTERGVNHLRNEDIVHDVATEALKDEKIWAEHEDSDGGLWFGTLTHGLFRYRDGRITRYTTATGLASNDIYSILEDGHHRFWMSSPVGVMLLRRDQLDARSASPDTPLAMRFFRADAGERPTRFYGGTQPSGIITHNGDTWFPTNQALWQISPGESEVPELSHLRIQDVRLDGRQTSPTAQLVLPASQSRLEIGYEPIYLNSQQDLQFRYRLEGFDKDWTLAGAQQRTATYTNLPPGSYTFTVQGWEMEHPEHLVTASVVFVKRPYFYRTFWFLAASLFAVAVISLLAYQYRMKQVHDRFAAVLAERTRLAREMHDTLIQGCAGVSAMLEAASACEKEDHETREHMVDYANTQIRSLMDEARQAVWNLRKGETARKDLSTCIQQMGDRFSREYSVEIACQTEGQPFEIGQQATHELTMVAREGLLNSVLHGNPSEIQAVLSFSSNTLNMRISDDGKGFDPSAQPEGHYGLQGVKERVHRFGGTVQIESKLNRGTHLRVSVPRAKLCG